MTSYLENEMLKQIQEIQQRIETLRFERTTYQSRVAEIDNIINQKLNEENETEVVTRKRVKNLIITGPTQAGKTARIIQACVAEKNTKKFIVISCDNLKAQLSQMLSRFRGTNIPVFTVTQLNYQEVSSYLKDGKSVVAIILNNEAQVKKIDCFIGDLQLHHDPSSFVFFHDEGDMVNKADDIADLKNNTIAKSHQRWVFMMDKIGKGDIPAVRAFVTATPENCSYISDIKGKDIIVLPIDVDYRGISEHKVWDKTNLDEIRGEVERIRHQESREAILYSVYKKNEKQDEIARDFSERFDCVALTFNMKGFKIYEFGRDYEDYALDFSQDDSISLVFQKLVDAGPVIVVGYNLMNRGISFVGSNLNQSVTSRPLTATTMFVEMGDKSHVVGTVQRLGRGCGTSRPELSTRKVYCSQKMYDDYQNYLKNQRIVFSDLDNPNHRNKTISEILEISGEAQKLQNKLDRPGLKKTNTNYDSSCSGNSSDPENIQDTNIDKMKRLVRRWKNEVNLTTIAKVFRTMVQNNGTLESSNILNIIRENTQDGSYYTNMTAPVSIGNNWGLIFRKDGTNHYIKPEALEYYNSL